MESTQTPATSAGATPRDFFLWLGAIIALYTSITAFLVLLFEYINRAFPDALDMYVDPLGTTIRTSIAVLVVSVPLTVVLLRYIRTIISADASRAEVWIRRWALVLTLFLAAATVAIDLIVVIDSFLSGEITTRFILKALVILLVASGVFMHFLADLKGYWVSHPRRASAVGIGFIGVAVAAIVAGFFFIGSPSDIRAARLDEKRTQDLQIVQGQLVNYWQTREALPESLEELEDPIGGYVLPQDPETGASYEYQRTGARSFELCATFAAASPNASEEIARSRSYIEPGMLSPWFEHEAGRTCFTREINPAAYPPFPKTVPAR